MLKKELTINFKQKKYKLSPITAIEYYNLREQSIPIFEHYGHYLTLSNLLAREAPNFDHPRFYVALKSLFGESDELYDDYKCS